MGQEDFEIIPKIEIITNNKYYYHHFDISKIETYNDNMTIYGKTDKEVVFDLSTKVSFILMLKTGLIIFICETTPFSKKTEWIPRYGFCEDKTKLNFVNFDHTRGIKLRSYKQSIDSFFKSLTRKLKIEKFLKDINQS